MKKKMKLFFSLLTSLTLCFTMLGTGAFTTEASAEEDTAKLLSVTLLDDNATAGTTAVYVKDANGDALSLDEGVTIRNTDGTVIGSKDVTYTSSSNGQQYTVTVAAAEASELPDGTETVEGVKSGNYIRFTSSQGDVVTIVSTGTYAYGKTGLSESTEAIFYYENGEATYTGTLDSNASVTIEGYTVSFYGRYGTYSWANAGVAEGDEVSITIKDGELTNVVINSENLTVGTGKVQVRVTDSDGNGVTTNVALNSGNEDITAEMTSHVASLGSYVFELTETKTAETLEAGTYTADLAYTSVTLTSSGNPTVTALTASIGDYTVILYYGNYATANEKITDGTVTLTVAGDGSISSLAVSGDIDLDDTYSTLEVWVYDSNGPVYPASVTVADTDEDVVITASSSNPSTDSQKVRAVYLFTLAKGKVSEPSIDKTADKTSVAAGEAIGYSLTSTVPETMQDSIAYTLDENNNAVGTAGEYVLVFHDTLDNGLTLDSNSIAVAVGGNAIDAKYYALDVSGITVTVDLAALYNDGVITDADLGAASVVVTYSATLSEDATAGTYSNNAYVTWTDGGTSVTDTATVATYQIKVYKYDSSDESGLAGATFELTNADGNVVATLTSGEDGYVTTAALAEGTYYLTETGAPEGYVKSDSAVTVTVSEENATDYVVTVNFANAAIPSTGGMGTTLYTLIGLMVLLAAGAVFMVSRKRRA